MPTTLAPFSRFAPLLLLLLHPPTPSCQVIRAVTFTKGESCFRCKWPLPPSFPSHPNRFLSDCTLDESCLVCNRCLHASSHKDHNISFFIAQQSGGCCDCGDAEAWRQNIQCPFHPLVYDSDHHFDPAPDITPRVLPKFIPDVDIPPVPRYPFCAAFPPELRDKTPSLSVRSSQLSCLHLETINHGCVPQIPDLDKDTSRIDWMFLYHTRL